MRIRLAPGTAGIGQDSRVKPCVLGLQFGVNRQVLAAVDRVVRFELKHRLGTFIFFWDHCLLLRLPFVEEFLQFVVLRMVLIIHQLILGGDLVHDIFYILVIVVILGKSREGESKKKADKKCCAHYQQSLTIQQSSFVKLRAA